MKQNCTSNTAQNVKLLDMNDIAQHNTKDDCWLVLYNNVYNLSSYIKVHPGGSDIILKYGGKDATGIFATIHSESMLLEILPKKCYIGKVDVATIKQHHIVINDTQQQKRASLPPLNKFINIKDFEQNAATLLQGTRPYSHIFGGSFDEITMRENTTYFHKIFLRPNVMVDVSNINMKTRLFGAYETSFPCYLSSTGLSGLAHPDADCALINAAKHKDIYFMLSTFPTKSMQDIYNECVDDSHDTLYKNTVLLFQAYILKDRNKTKQLIEKAVKYGFCKILCVTVDHPCLGKRERDQRGYSNSKGMAHSPASLISEALNWNDLVWIKEFVQEMNVKYDVKKGGIKLVLKGIQSRWDAYKYGLDGIIVSNHGGRQLDFSRASIQVLIEVMDELKKIGAENKIEVYMDGGIRRGSDIFKAIALGATAVGIGRAALFGLTCYGQKGVQKVVQILKNELGITMKLMGTPTIADIRENMYRKQNMLVINDMISKL
eukprot:265309_1